MVKMKDSGIEWIGEIPEKWKAVPIYTCTSEITQKNFDLKEKRALKFTYGNIVDKNNFNIDEDPALTQTASNYLVVKPNDIVINGLNLNYDFVTQRVGMVNNNGIITSAYIGIRPNQAAVIPKYLLYLFKTYDAEKAFHNMGGGVRKILNYSELKKEKVILPSVVQQRFIADFLDKKCADIDKLSEQIQREIEALQKYHKSIITKAVTKGLDDNVPMKDSGIKWIGEIPEDWQIIKGKYILKLLNRAIPKNAKIITCFRDGQVTLRENRRTDGFTISTKEIGYQGVKINDLVVHSMDGFAGAIGISDANGKASPVLNVMDSSENKNYLKYYLRNCAFIGVFQALAKGIRVRTADTRWSTLANLEYIIPPRSQQKDIADFLDNKTSQIDKIIKQKQHQLSLLSDYKNSLIFDYVTGKKQIPSNGGAK